MNGPGLLHWPVILFAAAAALACAGGMRPPPAEPALAPALPCAGVDSGRTSTGTYFECYGTGSEPVVLIHAFSMDRRMWAPQLPALRGWTRLFAYDLRAHGRTPAATGPYSSIDDLAELLDELSIPSAHLVGLSNGARIALDFALVHPKRVRSLVLASGAPSGFSGGDFSYMAPVMQAARAGDLERAAELWAETPLMRIGGDSAASALIRRISVDNASLWGIRSNPERNLDPAAIGRLSEVTVPVLVITGGNDLPFLRQLADTLVRGIRGARKVVIPDAGHMVNLAAPAEFNRALEAFLRDQGVRSRGQSP